MSTRSVVIVKDIKNESLIYHHWDGYPEGVGYDLLEKSKNFPEYWWVDSITNKLLKDKEDDGYEWTNGIHSDIEYLYVIDCEEKKIKCFKVIWNFDTDERWQKYEDIYKGKWGKEIDIYKMYEDDKKEN